MSRKKILFLSPYPWDKAPSQRLKYEQYYRYFEDAGYELTTSSFVSTDFWKVIYQKGHYPQKILFTVLGYFRRLFDLFRLRRYDLVYVHLWVTPIGPSLFEWLVTRLARKLVYDIDDLVYLNDQRKQNKVMLWIRGRGKPIALMKSADHVICCTPRLEEFVRQYNDQVTDISSTINTDVYRPRSAYEPGEPIVIGWSGSHSTSRYLHLLKVVFQKLSTTHNFVLKVIGDADFEMEGIEVKALAWSAEREVAELSEFDIGVYPLPLDEEWVYGKSGLKALQYMALGIPTVATAIGANFRIIDHERTGLLVKSEEEWVEALSNLISDKSLQQQMGKASAEFVDRHYSVKANAKVYLGVFSQVFEL